MDHEEKDAERQPLNAMVAENLKNVIIRKIYRDVERNVGSVKKDCSPVFRQFLAASGPVISALGAGMSAGFSAILLPQLRAVDSDIVITDEEGSWIASMLALPLAFGCIFSGYLMDTLGRKLGQIVSCVPFTIGWIVLALAPNVPALYVGRFITGFCVGLVSPMCQVYIAETSQPKYRGILLSGAPLSVAIGILIAHTLGTFFSWRLTAGICSLPSFICILILAFAPESPMWLLAKKRVEDAEKAFRWFRGYSDEATKEFNGLANKNESASGKNEPAKTNRQLFCDLSFVKPFIVLNSFFFVQQFSGVNAVAFYSVNILKEVLVGVNEYLATIIIDIVRFCFSVIAVVLLKKYGRKLLSVISAIGTGISLFLLAIYLGFFSSNAVVPITAAINETLDAVNGTNATAMTTFVESSQSWHSYLPLVLLISYISFVSIGIVPIPWVLTGELFSKEMRGVGSGGTSCFGFLCYFIVVKTSPVMFMNLGNAGTFCLFGVVSIAGAVIISLFLPETKDKTLMEIEAFYKKKTKPMEPSELKNCHVIQA